MSIMDNKTIRAGGLLAAFALTLAALAVAAAPRWTRVEPVNGSGEFVVTDAYTGLMWKGCQSGYTGSDCDDDVSTEDKLQTWDSAVTYCAALDWGGYSDWRLPNVRELPTTVDDGRPEFEALIDPDAFPNMEGSLTYWSSTTFAGDPGEAWSLEAYAPIDGGGGVYPWSKTSIKRVLCVRD